MALKSFNVERQAYHGGSFIGNHVHKALQVPTFIICKSYLVFLFIQSENIETMCKSVILTAASISDTAIQRKAQEIHDKFVDVFVLFSHCHKIYDSSKLLTDAEIDTLGMIIIVYILPLHKFSHYRDSHRNLSELLQRDLHNSIYSSKNAHAERSYSALNEEVESGMWMHGGARC